MMMMIIVVKRIISVAYWTKSNQDQKLELCMQIKAATTTMATMMTVLLRCCDSHRLCTSTKKKTNEDNADAVRRGKEGEEKETRQIYSI
jgi:hypothetical protein